MRRQTDVSWACYSNQSEKMEWGRVSCARTLVRPPTVWLSLVVGYCYSINKSCSNFVFFFVLSLSPIRSDIPICPNPSITSSWNNLSCECAQDAHSPYRNARIFDRWRAAIQGTKADDFPLRSRPSVDNECVNQICLPIFRINIFRQIKDQMEYH